MPLQVSQTLAGLQVGEVGTKWTRAGTELFAINTRRDGKLDLLDQNWHHLSIIWKCVLASRFSYVYRLFLKAATLLRMV
jgi:hypothetical protein